MQEPRFGGVSLSLKKFTVADETIDYRFVRFEHVAKDVDVVVDIGAAPVGSAPACH